MNTVARLLGPEDIVLNVDVADKQLLFEEIGRHMERKHAMPRESVVSSLDRREKAGSTGLGEGVAIPHARVSNLARIQAAYFRLKSPIPFNAPDDKPVSDILALLVPLHAAEEHLTILADAARMFSSPRFREELHLCDGPSAVKQLFTSF